jgi:hypothetical protein
MEKNSPCKKITFSQPEGSWKKGKQKFRWLDSVLKYVGPYRTVEPEEEEVYCR